MKLCYHIYWIKSTNKGAEKRVKGRWPLRGMEGAAEAPPGVQGQRPCSGPQANETCAFRESPGFEKQLTQPQKSRSPTPILLRVRRRRKQPTTSAPAYSHTICSGIQRRRCIKVFGNPLWMTCGQAVPKGDKSRILATFAHPQAYLSTGCGFVDKPKMQKTAGQDFSS